MARTKRDGWMDGPPGSKLKLNNMRGGLGTALLAMEQTLLNLPQGEVDILTASYRELMEDAIRLVKLRMKDLLRSPSQRKFIKLNDISSALVQFTQAYQTFIGYTTRTMSVPVDAVQAALESTDQGIKNLDTFLAELDAKIEAARKDLALPPGESVIDLGPDAVEAEAEEEREPDSSQVVMEGHLDFMRRNGYLDENNKWTGLQPDEKAPDFVRIRLKAIVEAAGDDPGRV